MLKLFYWQGITSEGHNQTGTLYALSQQQAYEQLKTPNFYIKSLKLKPMSYWQRYKNQATQQDIIQVTHQIATMLDASFPLIQSLNLLANHHPKAEIRCIFIDACQYIHSGIPLSKSLQLSSHHFDHLYIQWIQCSEQTGELAKAFTQLANYLERRDTIKRQVKNAMIYPQIIMFVAVVVIWLMLTKVIPEFENMYQGLGHNLPWLTQTILNCSAWVQHFGWYLLGSILFGIISIKMILKRSAVAGLIIEQFWLKIPMIRTLLLHANIIIFSRTLANSLQAGIPILSGLQNCKTTTPLVFFQQSITLIHQHTAQGVPLSKAIKNTKQFPELMIQMIQVGEQSGKLDGMLYKIAHTYEENLNNHINNLTKLIEPFLILIFGGMIGGLIGAMYLPIFNLMSVLG